MLNKFKRLDQEAQSDYDSNQSSHESSDGHSISKAIDPVSESEVFLPLHAERSKTVETTRKKSFKEILMILIAFSFNIHAFSVNVSGVL